MVKSFRLTWGSNRDPSDCEQSTLINCEFSNRNFDSSVNSKLKNISIIVEFFRVELSLIMNFGSNTPKCMTILSKTQKSSKYSSLKLKIFEFETQNFRVWNPVSSLVEFESWPSKLELDSTRKNSKYSSFLSYFISSRVMHFLSLLYP